MVGNLAVDAHNLPAGGGDAGYWKHDPLSRGMAHSACLVVAGG
ncbi:MAG: hypothetical protein WCO97_07885 [bacterium]